MEITLTTPALLFPAISLLMVAYTNRFLALGSRIRTLSAQYRSQPDRIIVNQLANLRKRVILIRNMQAFGVASLFSCVCCMFALFANHSMAGQVLFGISLIFMLLSLGLSLREILISVQALNLELETMESGDRKHL